MTTQISTFNVLESLTNISEFLGILPRKNDYVHAIITALKQKDTPLAKKMITYLDNFKYRTWGSIDAYTAYLFYKDIFDDHFFGSTGTERDHDSDVIIARENKTIKGTTAKQVDKPSIINSSHNVKPTTTDSCHNVKPTTVNNIYNVKKGSVNSGHNAKIITEDRKKQVAEAVVMITDHNLGLIDLMNWRDNNVTLLKKIYPLMDPDIDVDTMLLLFYEYLGFEDNEIPKINVNTCIVDSTVDETVDEDDYEEELIFEILSDSESDYDD